MEEGGHTLNEEEFFDACGKLYEAVTVIEKSVIMKDKNAKEKSQQDNETKFKVFLLLLIFLALNKCQFPKNCSQEETSWWRCRLTYPEEIGRNT